ncbi:MAG: hypothetical protein QXP31_00745 [Pyrobaculum sp.]
METFCLYDVKAYVKAKDDVVVFPEGLRGARVEDVLKGQKVWW